MSLTSCAGFWGSEKPDTAKPQERPTTIIKAKKAASSQSQQSRQKTIKVKKTHPRKYTVKKGDTLWGISSLFLQDPWYWPEIWYKNQQVKNPHLIYPGDVLTLIYIEGEPKIVVNQQSVPVKESEETAPSTVPDDIRRVKLSPSIRRDTLEASIATIPSDAIQQFLTRPRVVTKKEFENAPYIVGSNDRHLILGQDNRIYVRGELDKERVRFTVFRAGAKLVDPDTDKILGYEAIYAGEAHIDRYGDPALGTLTRTEREILIGDRLLPIDKSKINSVYFPHVPDVKINAKVISLFDALFGIAKHQIAVINKGDRDGVEVGHLLATLTRGERVRDNYSPRSSGSVNLPDERSGLMMIFRTFDKVSYGLMLESTGVIHNLDVVTNPR